MILQDEQLGTKDKYCCRFPDRPEAEKWLLKLPRLEPGKAEHLAEKIACEVAMLLGIPCAKVELAEYEGQRGTRLRATWCPYGGRWCMVTKSSRAA